MVGLEQFIPVNNVVKLCIKLVIYGCNMILVFKEANTPTQFVWVEYPELKDLYRQPYRLVKIITKHNLYDAYGYNKFRFIIIGKIEDSLKDFLKAHIAMGRAVLYEANDTNWE